MTFTMLLVVDKDPLSCVCLDAYVTYLNIWTCCLKGRGQKRKVKRLY